MKYSDLQRQVAQCPMFDGIWSKINPGIFVAGDNHKKTNDSNS